MRRVSGSVRGRTSTLLSAPALSLSQGGRVPVMAVLLLVLVLAGAAAAAGVAISRHNARQKGQITQLERQLTVKDGEITQLQGLLQDQDKQLEELARERKSLSERVEILRSRLSTTTTELEESRARVEELNRRYDQLTQERLKLEAELAQVSSEREEIRQQVRRLEQDNDELKRSVNRVRERMALVERDYEDAIAKLTELQVSQASPANPGNPLNALELPALGESGSGDMPALQGTIQLPPIIVQKEQAGATGRVRGRLVEVDGTHGFLVLDKGSADGVRMGMAFDILRGNHPVGRATVVRVRPKLSACDILRAQTPGPLQVGDLAVQGGL